MTGSDPVHFAAVDASNAACDETVPRGVRRGFQDGEYTDRRFTADRERTTCPECLWRLARVATTPTTADVLNAIAARVDAASSYTPAGITRLAADLSATIAALRAVLAECDGLDRLAASDAARAVDLVLSEGYDRGQYVALCHGASAVHLATTRLRAAVVLHLETR